MARGKKEGNKMEKIINLTPHTINFVGQDNAIIATIPHLVLRVQHNAGKLWTPLWRMVSLCQLHVVHMATCKVCRNQWMTQSILCPQSPRKRFQRGRTFSSWTILSATKTDVSLACAGLRTSEGNGGRKNET